jgi:uncharacterized damage-inducible protein DinB
MTQNKDLADRLKEVVLEGYWIANTNFNDQLIDMDWKAATKKIKPTHSIADLAQHIHYYISGLLNVFNTGKLEIQDKFSFSFPPIKSQKSWDEFKDKLWKDTAELCQLIERMTPEELNQDFVDKRYGSYQRNIEALIEHSYYHLGQIVLIKKINQV